MDKYNFEDENDLFGATVRLDDINKQVKNYERENKKNTDPKNHADSGNENQEKGSATQSLENVVKGIRQTMLHNRPNKEQDSGKHKEIAQETPSFHRERTGTKRKKNANKKMWAAFLVLGVLLFMSVFLLAFRAARIQTGPGEQMIPPENTQTVVNNEDVYEAVVLVKNINASKELSVYDLDKQEDASLLLDQNVEVTGFDGEILKVSDVNMADVVKITAEDERVKKIEYTQDVERITGITDYTLSEDRGTLTTKEGVSYPFANQAMLIYRNRLIEAEDLESIDIVSLTIYQDKIWSLTVDEFHGYLVLKNIQDLKEGTITIDNAQAQPLPESGRIPILQGPHSIVLTGTDFETYTAEIYVTAGEEFEITIQTKTGVLMLKVNVSDYQLFIDGVEILDPAQPQVLNMGEYLVRVEKEGYLPWEQTIQIKEPSLEVEVNLEEELKTGKLFITTTPENAYIYIDKVYIGVSPIETDVIYGDHRLLVEKEGYLSVDSPIHVNKEYEAISVPLEERQQQ